MLGLASGANAAEEPADLVADYVRLVLAGESASAATLWAPQYLAECARLDIQYPAASSAYDLASPLHTQLDEIRSGRMRLQIGVADIEGSDFVVPVQLLGGPVAPPFEYAVVQVGEDWKLAGRIWAAGRHWARVESEFVIYHCQDPAQLTASARRALDAHIAQTSKLLGEPSVRLDALRRSKILYYLADETTVTRLTGYPTKGMAELATGSVISSHFPHHHELAHLQINHALQEAPLYPLPLLQEGAACLLAGRWGRAPRVIKYMGWVHHNMGLVSLPDILTREGFYTAAGGPDATYAAGAVLSDLIVAQAGWQGLLELQPLLAKTDPPQTAETIAGEILRVCGWESDSPLPGIQEKFESKLLQNFRGGVEPFPGEAHAFSDKVSIRQGDGWFEFVVPAGDNPVAILPTVFLAEEGSAHSSLFAEVMRGFTYGSQPAGIRCSASSISVYDFSTNRLLAVWAGDFSGEPQGARSGEGQIRFRLTQGVLPDELLTDGSWELALP